MGGFIAGQEDGWKDEGRIGPAVPSLPPLRTARAASPSSAPLFLLYLCRCPSEEVMKTEMHKVIQSHDGGESQAITRSQAVYLAGGLFKSSTETDRGGLC